MKRSWLLAVVPATDTGALVSATRDSRSRILYVKLVNPNDGTR